jgi:transposase
MNSKADVNKGDGQGMARGLEVPPNPEVVPRATRRTFTAEYKLRILKEAEACTAQERGALLRREGLYASHLTYWRQQREKGSLAGLATQKRGPKQDADRAKARRIAELEREVEQLKARLEKAETVIEVQKKSQICLAFRLRAPPVAGAADRGCRGAFRPCRYSGGVPCARCPPGDRVPEAQSQAADRRCGKGQAGPGVK